MPPLVIRSHKPTSAWHWRASPFARLACLAYVVLVVYASLAPWTGWRGDASGAFAYLTAPWPRFVTRFDVLVNVLGYLPLGALAVLALHPTLRGPAAVVAATLFGVALSASIEALQTFLPQRIASQVDLLANSAGALIGATLAAPVASALIDRGRLAQWRHRWFVRDAAIPLVLLALWPAAQAHPGPMLFGFGVGDGALLEAARAWGLAVVPAREAWGTTEFALAQAAVTTAGTLMAGLTAAAIMQPRAPRLRLLLGLVATALLAKTLFYALRFGPEQSLAWLNPAAAAGLAVGLLALSAAMVGSARAAARVALVAGIAALILVALVPANPEYLAWAAQWRSGRLVHFNAVAQWLAFAWPFAVLLWLLTARVRRR